MTEVKIEIVNAEALVVGPNEMLVLKFPDDSETLAYMPDVMEALRQAGLADRSLVFVGEVEFSEGAAAKLTAAVILRNELHRYLAPCLDHLLAFCDEIVIWDNGSTDGWEETLRARWPVEDNSRVKVISDEDADSGTSSMFVNHAAARQQLCVRTVASGADWILAVDADEFITDGWALRERLDLAGSRVGAAGICLMEVWQADEDELRIRQDGGWVEHEVKLCWRPAFTPPPHVIVDRGPATGRTPESVNRALDVSACVGLLHFGWVKEAERIDRHHRYVVADGGRFHQSAHLDSILWPDTMITLAPTTWPEALLSHREAILAAARPR